MLQQFYVFPLNRYYRLKFVIICMLFLVFLFMLVCLIPLFFLLVWCDFLVIQMKNLIKFEKKTLTYEFLLCWSSCWVFFCRNSWKSLSWNFYYMKITQLYRKVKSCFFGDPSPLCRWWNTCTLKTWVCAFCKIFGNSYF